jgi:hypothetical protein
MLGAVEAFPFTFDSGKKALIFLHGAANLTIDPKPEVTVKFQERRSTLFADVPLTRSCPARLAPSLEGA